MLEGLSYKGTITKLKVTPWEKWDKKGTNYTIVFAIMGSSFEVSCNEEVYKKLQSKEWEEVAIPLWFSLRKWVKDWNAWAIINFYVKSDTFLDSDQAD